MVFKPDVAQSFRAALVFAAGPAWAAIARRGRQTIGPEGFLRANAPVRGRLDWIAIDRVEVASFGPDVHSFVAQV